MFIRKDFVKVINESYIPRRESTSHLKLRYCFQFYTHQQIQSFKSAYRIPSFFDKCICEKSAFESSQNTKFFE